MLLWMDPRALLRHAVVYKTFQSLIGGRKARRRFVAQHVRPQTGEKILDIGCGPGDILDFLPAVTYHGVDLDPAYIAAARRGYGARGTFTCSGVDGLTVPDPGTFDVALAAGLLHHLADEEARQLFRAAATALKPGGRLLTLDGCFADGQPVVSRLLLKADRGAYVREQPAYEALAQASFAQVQATIEERFFNVPYTLLIMECRNP